jgi:hypothetical protein
MERSSIITLTQDCDDVPKLSDHGICLQITTLFGTCEHILQTDKVFFLATRFISRAQSRDGQNINAKIIDYNLKPNVRVLKTE